MEEIENLLEEGELLRFHLAEGDVGALTDCLSGGFTASEVAADDGYLG